MNDNGIAKAIAALLGRKPSQSEYAQIVQEGQRVQKKERNAPGWRQKAWDAMAEAARGLS